MQSSFCFFKEPACLFGIGTVCEDQYRALTCSDTALRATIRLRKLETISASQTLGSSLLFKRVSCRAKKERSEEYWERKKWKIPRIWSVQKRKEHRIIRLCSVAKIKNRGLQFSRPKKGVKSTWNLFCYTKKKVKNTENLSVSKRTKWRKLIICSVTKQTREEWWESVQSPPPHPEKGEILNTDDIFRRSRKRVKNTEKLLSPHPPKKRKS